MSHPRKLRDHTPLKVARCGRELTQADLCSRLGLNESTYSRIELGLQMPDVITAQRIAALVGSTVAELWPAPAGVAS
jgi:DNA-binding XRE family transcriptional regulator